MCCANVMVENVNQAQASRMGLYEPMADGTTKNGAPVYTSSNGNELWYLGIGGWMIGSDNNQSNVGGFKSPVRFNLFPRLICKT